MALLIAHYGLPIVAIIIFAGELGLPTLIPSEIGLLIAGNQAINSVAGLVAAIAIFGAIDLIATTTIHCAARTGGNSLLRRLLLRLTSGKKSPDAMMDAFRTRLGGRDSLVVFCTRLIPVFRLYASITTGLIRVRLREFIAGAAPAAWLWASIPLTAGFLLKAQVGPVANGYMSTMQYVLPLSVGLTALAMAAIWAKSRGMLGVRSI